MSVCSIHITHYYIVYEYSILITYYYIVYVYTLLHTQDMTFPSPGQVRLVYSAATYSYQRDLDQLQIYSHYQFINTERVQCGNLYFTIPTGGRDCTDKSPKLSWYYFQAG